MVAPMPGRSPHPDLDMQSLVDGLSSAQKAELRNLLNFDASKTRRGFSTWEKAVYDEMVRVSVEGPGRYAPLEVFAKQQGVGKFNEGCAALDEFISKNCAEIMRLPRRVAVVKLMLQALSDYLVSIDVPPTPKTLLNNIKLTGWAVDQQFPGYVSNRLLHMLALPNQTR